MHAELVFAIGSSRPEGSGDNRYDSYPFLYDSEKGWVPGGQYRRLLSIGISPSYRWGWPWLFLAVRK